MSKKDEAAAPVGKATEQARRARQAEALRRNLGRRKAQARERAADPTTDRNRESDTPER